MMNDPYEPTETRQQELLDIWRACGDFSVRRPLGLTRPGDASYMTLEEWQWCGHNFTVEVNVTVDRIVKKGIEQ